MRSWPTFPGKGSLQCGGTGRGQEGIALILAVVSVFLLTLAVFQTRAGVDLAEEIAIRNAQEMQALYMARSGLAMVQDALVDDDKDVDSYKDDWAAANDVGAVPIAEVGWAVGKVSDEEGKFNVLDLVNDKGESDDYTDFAAQRFLDLLLEIGLSDTRAEEIVDSLIDWMDADGTVTGAGAEEQYYTSLSHPYSCPNDVPAGIDDLTLVKGIGPVLLYQGEGEVPPLIDFVTVYGDKKPGDRFRRVNINTAPLAVISTLIPDMDPQLAEEIVASRDAEPFKTAAEIKEVPGFPDEMFNADVAGFPDDIKLAILIDVSSEHFAATITGETAQASSRVYGVFERKEGTAGLVYYRGF